MSKRIKPFKGDARKVLGHGGVTVGVPLWVLTDLCMAAENGGLAEPAREAIQAAHKAIGNLEKKA